MTKIIFSRKRKIIKLINEHPTSIWQLIDERRFNKVLQVNGLIKLICFFLMITTIVYMYLYLLKEADIRFFFFYEAIWVEYSIMMDLDRFASNDSLPLKEYLIEIIKSIILMRYSRINSGWNQCWICHFTWCLD